MWEAHEEQLIIGGAGGAEVSAHCAQAPHRDRDVIILLLS